MKLGFVPDGRRIIDAVQEQVKSRKPDMLRSLCNSCVYGFFDFILPQECRACVVQQGIADIRRKGAGT